MQREIKFRAWGSFGKKMHYQKENQELFSFLREFHGMDLMQFTGLHDKNGKEIYEGDIIKMNSYSTYGAKFQCTQTVEYFGQGFNIGKTEIHWGGFDGVEVIGNIYENPTLTP